MIWNQILYIHVLLAAVAHRTYASSTARQLVTGCKEALQALVAAGAEATRRECCALNQPLAQLAFQGRW